MDVSGNLPEDFAAALVAGMPDAVIYADSAGIIRYWNEASTRVFGFSEAEALGASLDLITPESLRARHWLGYHETMRTGVTRYGDGQLLAVPALRADGTRISIEFTIRPFADANGRMVGVAAVMRDVTARFEELRTLRRQIASGAAEHQTQAERGAAE